MPITEDGSVLHEGYVSHDADAGTVTFLVDGEQQTFPVTDGHCKLQWKVDWAMRWIAFGVDYEMAGKDLIDSVTLSGKIVRALGRKPPAGFIYEMFLDEQGKKISKSLGNGLTIDEWLTYGPQESLAYYLYKEPKKAKKLFVRAIPRAIDDYLKARKDYLTQTPEQRLGNPVYHVGNVSASIGAVRSPPSVTFGLLLNLVSILGDTDEETVWNYLQTYGATGGRELRELIPYAIRYHRDHVAASITYKAPNADERAALEQLVRDLGALTETSEEAIQSAVYETGKATGYADNLRGWFKLVYEVVFGSPEGPRLGTFIGVYGVPEFIALLEQRLEESHAS
jgi:lysyl-tRNA synthetase class 1